MTAPSKAERDEMRARHKARVYRGETLPYCEKDADRWPCERVRLLDALDEADRRAQTVRGMCRTDDRDQMDPYGNPFVYVDNILAALGAALPPTTD